MTHDPLPNETIISLGNHTYIRDNLAPAPAMSCSWSARPGAYRPSVFPA